MGSRPWPLLAARMNQIRDQGGPALLGAHLTRLKDDTSFKNASGAAAVGRLVDATLNSLTTPPSEPAADPGLRGGGPLPLHHHPRRRGPRPAGPDRSRRPGPPPAGRTGQERGTGTVAPAAAADLGISHSRPGPVDPEFGQRPQLLRVQPVPALALVGQPHPGAVDRPGQVLDVLAAGQSAALPLHVLRQSLDTLLEGRCAPPGPCGRSASTRPALRAVRRTSARRCAAQPPLLLGGVQDQGLAPGPGPPAEEVTP